MRAGIASLIVAGFVVIAGTQGQPAFTVASVRPSAPGERGMFASPRPGGGFSARNATVFYLLNMAYGLPANRILGGPDWMDTEYFDVEAKYEPADASAPVPPMQLMLQTLLRERFALDAAMEKRDRPIYALRLVRNGQMGSRRTVRPVDSKLSVPVVRTDRPPLVITPAATNFQVFG